MTNETRQTEQAIAYRHPRSLPLRSLSRLRERGMLVVLLLLSAGIAAINPRFLSSFNLQMLSVQVAIFGILAIGETAAILTGGIDLSVGSVLAISGVFVTLLMKLGLPPLVAIGIVLVLGAGIGLYHGAMVAKVGVAPFIVTLGTLSIVRGLGLGITRGWPVYPVPDEFTFLGQAALVGIPIPLILLVVIVSGTSFILNRTILGRHVYAVGGNLVASRLSGVDVDRVRMFVYAFSSFMAALTGIIVASKLSQGQPGVGSGYELNAIAASIIGGARLSGGEGTIAGALIGAAIMSVVDNGLVLSGVSAYWQQVVVGCIIVVAVVADTLRGRMKASRKGE